MTADKTKAKSPRLTVRHSARKGLVYTWDGGVDRSDVNRLDLTLHQFRDALKACGFDLKTLKITVRKDDSQ